MYWRDKFHSVQRLKCSQPQSWGPDGPCLLVFTPVCSRLPHYTRLGVYDTTTGARQKRPVTFGARLQDKASALLPLGLLVLGEASCRVTRTLRHPHGEAHVNKDRRGLQSTNVRGRRSRCGSSSRSHAFGGPQAWLTAACNLVRNPEPEPPAMELLDS